MASTTDLTTLKINYLTQAQYDTALANNQINSNELYLTPAGAAGTITGVTAGTGLSGGGTSGAVTLNHSNSITAKTTSAVYPIKIDAQGHISEAGNAVTIPTITLNGSNTTSASFYAPTSAGTSGYYLKSGGSNTAPSWASFPTIPSITLNGSSNTSPSFYAPTGAGTSGQYLKSNGSGAPSWTNFPTIPSITLNGSSTTSPSFYAPTGAGSSGQYLKSNGSGAPSWTTFPTIPTITLNGSATTSPSFYAPTSAGTNGYVLKSNGSGAPGWVSATLTDTMVTVAENTKTTKYYPILATGTGTATRQIDTNDKNDSSATASGLWYQDGVLCAPSLQVGDLDYSLTTAEYNALNTALDAIQ